MARSLRSKRRKQNKRELRKRYKPRYDAQLKAIVATFQEKEQNDEEVMDDAADQPDFVGYQVKTLKSPVNNSKADNTLAPSNNKMEDNDDDDVESIEADKDSKDPEVKIPRVDIKKVAQFMSQRKYRTYQAKVKRVKKRIANQKPGEKKKRIVKW